MKSVCISLLALLALSFVGCTEQKETTVNIILVGENKASEISVALPIKGLGLYNYEVVQLTDSVTILTIPMERISPFDLALRDNGIYGNYLLEPGKTYNITINLSEPDDSKVSIDDPALQQFSELYSTRNFYKYEWVRDYTQYPIDTVASRMKDNFEELIENDKSMFADYQMSKQLERAIDDDIELYWMGTMSKIIRNNYREDRPMYEGYADLWDNIYKEYPFTERYIHSHWLYETSQIFFQSFLDHKYYREPTGSIAEHFDRYINDINENINDPKAREYILAQTLHHNLMNNKTFDTYLLKHIDRFYDEYGTERYADIFGPFVEDIEAYQEKIKGDLPGDIIIVENYDRIYTLKDAIALFKGKPLFIDFWFSTCGPCQAEFKQSAQLKEFLKQHDIQMLYISIDPEEMDREWRNMMKYYGLSGHHIRTDHKLHVDMDKNYDIHYYPHYMVVDSQGNIVVRRAHKPSTGEKLLDQIRTALEIR